MALAAGFRAGSHSRDSPAGGGERLTLHRGFASLLVGSGLNVVFVSRQLGHANANITLRVYAHPSTTTPPPHAPHSTRAT